MEKESNILPMLGGFILAIGGLIVFGIQIIDYLQYGYWTPCSFVDCILINLNSNISWAGVYEILDFFSLPLILMVIGGSILYSLFDDN